MPANQCGGIPKRSKGRAWKARRLVTGRQGSNPCSSATRDYRTIEAIQKSVRSKETAVQRPFFLPCWSTVIWPRMLDAITVNARAIFIIKNDLCTFSITYGANQAKTSSFPSEIVHGKKEKGSCFPCKNAEKMGEICIHALFV